MALDFFDCNCFFGRTAVPNPNSFSSRDDLVSKMDKYGISRALAYHSVARDHAPSEGNEILEKEIADEPRLEPVWVVMPHHTGEFPEPGRLLKLMKQKNVRAVRIYPSSAKQSFSLKEYSAGPLLSMLEEAGIPLFTDIDEIGWDNIDMLLEGHPRLPVILCNTGYRGDRYLYPLMHTYENLYIETSRFLSHLGIEALCRKVGSKRILFGSGMPFYTGAGAVFYIENLMLDESERRLIASGNLNAILNGVKL